MSVEAREPFDQAQLVARRRAADRGLVRQEIGRLDDQRVAFPASARLAHVGLDVREQTGR